MSSLYVVFIYTCTKPNTIINNYFSGSYVSHLTYIFLLLRIVKFYLNNYKSIFCEDLGFILERWRPNLKFSSTSLTLRRNILQLLIFFKNFFLFICGHHKTWEGSGFRFRKKQIRIQSRKPFFYLNYFSFQSSDWGSYLLGCLYRKVVQTFFCIFFGRLQCLAIPLLLSHGILRMSGFELIELLTSSRRATNLATHIPKI
jgi:hypothetical protein